MEASYTAPFNYARSVTKSDTVDFSPVGGRAFCDALHIGGAGTVAVVLEDNSVVSFTCAAGDLLPIRCKRVNSTGTAATLINAMYMV